MEELAEELTSVQDSASDDSDADADDAPAVAPLPLGVKADPSAGGHPSDEEPLPPSYVEAVDGATLLPRAKESV